MFMTIFPIPPEGSIVAGHLSMVLWGVSQKQPGQMGRNWLNIVVGVWRQRGEKKGAKVLKNYMLFALSDIIGGIGGGGVDNS